MRFSLLHLCFLLLMLVFGTESRALGKVSDGQKPHQGIYFRADLTGAGEEPSEVQDRIRESVAREYDSAPDVRDGPNLYTYVLQNPWSAFDPAGLESYPWWKGGWLRENVYDPVHNNVVLPVTGVAMDTVNNVGVEIASAVAYAPLIAHKMLGDNVDEQWNSVRDWGGRTSDPYLKAGFYKENAGTRLFKTAAPIMIPAAMASKAGSGTRVVTAGVADDAAAGTGQSATVVAAEAEVVAKTAGGAADEMVTVYRGVHAEHPQLANALRGRAEPMGGHSSPLLHNQGDDASVFTSWTTNRGTAVDFGLQNGPGGVLLEQTVPRSSLIRSPDAFGEFEVLRRGTVEGASTTIFSR